MEVKQGSSTRTVRLNRNERAKRLRQVAGLIDKDRREFTKPQHLGQLPRWVLGLQDIGIRDADAMSDIIFALPSQIERVIRDIAECRNDIVIKCRAQGLPLCAVVTLPVGAYVRCPGCGSRMETLPCVLCGPDWEMPVPEEAADYIESLDDGEDIEPIEPLLSTCAHPGSLEKLEVMAARFQKRQGLFHPQDPTVDFTHDRDYSADTRH